MDNRLFWISFNQFSIISNIEISQITNNETFSRQQFFEKINGKYLFIFEFLFSHCVYENHLFYINNIQNISINTTLIQNVVVNRDNEQSFIYINGKYIQIDYLIMQHLIDLNPFEMITSVFRIDALEQLFISNAIIINVQSGFSNLFQIDCKVLAIMNFQTDQINQISTLLHITSQNGGGIRNANFKQSNIENLIHFQNANLILLEFIFINKQEINNLFEFTNCTNVYLNSVYIYPGLKVQNLFLFKQQNYKLIKLSKIIIEKIQIINSLIDLKQSEGSIQIQNSYFNLVGQNQIKKSLNLANERFTLQNLTISGLKPNQISFKGKQIYLVNLAILDSFIESIKIVVLDSDLLDKERFIKGNLNINYIWFTVHNNQRLSKQTKSISFIQLSSPNNIYVLYHIKIINNQNLSKKFLQFDSKIQKQFSQIILINNDCENNCVDFYGKDYNQNDLFNYKTKNDAMDKQSQINAIGIKINNKLYTQEFLYLPSGQQLKDYKIFDLINGQSQNYIKQIEIIHKLNFQEQRLIGNFKIIAYKYDIKNKVVLNLTENILNFNNFTQTKDYNQLIELKITNNPYNDQNCVLLVISNEDDIKYERLSLLIKTFICQIGEIFRKDRCMQFDTEYQLYSLRQNSNLCSVFDSQIGKDFKHNSIKLREGYWRPFIYSHVIEKCNGKYYRCKGGWQTGNQLCKIGYQGGLCDSCDTQNIIGNGYFQMIDDQCKICDNQFKNAQFLMIKLLIIIIIYQVKLYFKSQSNQSFYSKYLLQKLIFHQHFQVINIYLIDLSSIIFDILIQNISITEQVLRNQEFNLPDLYGIFKNPIQFISNSTFCFSQYFGLEQYKVTLIFSFLFPFVIYNTFVLLSYAIGGFQIKKQHIFIQPMINLFILLGPTLLAQFTANLFYVEYSKQRYILSDLGVRYFSELHQQFIKYFLSPIILSFGLIIPLILWNQINQLTKILFKKQIFQTFGSLIIQYNVKFELIVRYYLTSLLLSLFQINSINMLITPKDVISIIVLMFSIKKTYKIKKFNKNLFTSWIFIGLVTYITKIEQEVIDAFYIQMCASLFIIIYIINKYIRQLIFAYDKQIYGFIQSRRKLSSYFISKILYNEKQYWKLINQLVKLHKLKFVSFKQQSEKIILQTVLKQSGQNYHNLPTLKTEANEGIEMQQL